MPRRVAQNNAFFENVSSWSGSVFLFTSYYMWFFFRILIWIFKSPQQPQSLAILPKIVHFFTNVRTLRCPPECLFGGIIWWIRTEIKHRKWFFIILDFLMVQTDAFIWTFFCENSHKIYANFIQMDELMLVDIV